MNLEARDAEAGLELSTGLQMTGKVQENYCSCRWLLYESLSGLEVVEIQELTLRAESGEQVRLRLSVRFESFGCGSMAWSTRERDSCWCRAWISR
jgi:hypothetical protein